MTLPPKKFVGLHAHTSKSIFDGFGSVEDHFDFVVSNGGDGLAITDHGNMNAASDAFQKQTEYDKKGINFNSVYGVEAYFIDDLDKWRQEKLARDEAKKEAKEVIEESSEKEDSSGENEEETKNVSKKFDPINRRKHMVLLAKSQKGLKNLFRIVSKSNREGFYRYPRVDMKMLREYGEDIVISGACIGGVSAGIVFEEFADTPQDQLSVDLLDDPIKMANIQRKIKNHYDELAEAVGQENVFLELQFNKLTAQHMVNRALIEFAQNSKYKLVSTADSHYNKPTLWRERELYKLIGRQMRGSKDGLNPSSLPQNISELKCELYPKNAEQMWAAYQSYKGDMSFYDDQLVADSIERTWDIAHNLIGKVTPDTSIKLPSFGAPPGVDPFTLLVDKCKEGMKKRGLSGKQQYIDRLKKELIVIKKLEFTQYFLTLKAVFECVEDKILFGAGRGSSAGSLVNYVLEITDVDPVANDLIFERFLSLARSKNDIPDIDIDCSDRDELIAILRERFGTKTVVPISNYNQLQLKSLVKDISKLHEVPFDQVNQMTKKLDDDVRPHMVTGDETKGAINLTYEACLEYSQEFKLFMEQYPAVAMDVQALYQQPKAVGRHAGGVILLDDPDSEMPLISVRGEIQTPWTEGMTSKSLSKLGLIKYDFLGLKTLRMFIRTIKLILQRHEGIKNPTNKEINDWYYTHITPSKIDPNDKNVLKNVFHEGRFLGIFQFTNSGAQEFIKELQPKNVTDISTATAIYRPGPLSADVDKLYIKARNSNQKKDYGHPKVNAALENTNGFIIFQEQIQKIAMELADFSPEDADRLRKAILKKTTKDSGKSKSETEILQEKFIEGSIKNGYPKHMAESLYEDMRAFAKYGFNCVSGSTMVESQERGRIAIQDLRPGEHILGSNGFTKVLNQFETGRKPTFKIKTKSGNELICTKDHKIMTDNGLMTLEEIMNDKKVKLKITS